ncbi:SgrR family transcriptional regulator [Bacillus salacetis]|uniref:SgrR family transcriptional regulator n=1 Tax=Bacillus salacetis TaxID=2315464 RepID=A0A3A1R0C1_9BACI|nr:SgrR family transcriptional regulator [Bacillus salacetis]RIW33281.1 SgrR family transcriptional regulator [Bacillus salacetis]
MKTLEHYARLFSFLNTDLEKENELSLSAVSEVLFCTPRNSKLTIQKWEQEGWIKWSPGRGRGNKSTLSFLKEPADLLFDESKTLVKKGKLAGAQEMISEYSGKFGGLEERFELWLDTLFGYSAESKNDKPRDVLRLKYGKQPFSPLDPMLASLRSECHILKHVCDTLVLYNEEKEVVEPRLAFHWEHNQAGDEWTFYIRKGVKFHDGNRLTSEDIQYSFHRFQSYEDNPYQWMLANVEETVILDEYALKLKLNHPNFLLLHILSDEHLSIVSKTSDSAVFQESLIGTGPFRLVKNNGSMLVLEANEYYFKERPFLDAVEFWNVPEETGDRTPGRTEVEFGYYREKDEGDKSRKRVKRVERNVQFLSFNGRKAGPMGDPLFRLALKAIIDPAVLVEELGEFRQEAAAGFLKAYSNEGSKEIQKILEQSIFNGEELFLYTFQDRDHVEDSEWLKQRCSRFGINIKNNFLPAEELLKKENIEKADIIHDSATITEQEDFSFLQLILAETSPIWHHLPEEQREIILNEVNHLKSLSNPEERMKKLYNIEETLLEDCHVLPLYKNMSELESDEDIQQAMINSQGWIDFYRIWFKRK